jgi:serine protease Do
MIKKNILQGAQAFFVGGCCVLVFFAVERQRSVETSLRDLEKAFVTRHTTLAADETQVVERVISSSQLWRPVQEKVKDTVVQVFSQIVEFDYLQPYRVPSQGQAYGSGFFINDQGDLLTNAHVVDQAKSVWIQIPTLGKRILDVEVVGVSPERDIALLRVKPADLAVIKSVLGAVPYLPLGDSDDIHRSDEVMALGYPLGQQSLKSTTGVISGREHNFIQMSAAINPGNSGGPLLNSTGQVIGINSAAITNAQNVGYMIPINDAKLVLSDLYKGGLLRKPFLGLLFSNASDYLTEYLGNPAPGGCYVVEVVHDSPLERAGVKRGDMVYEVNGCPIDIFGEMSVSWTEDKISIVDFVSRLLTGEKIELVVYRKGKRKTFSVAFDQTSLPTVRKVYPGYEEIDYEIFGGMVIMQLSLNHIHGLSESVPGLAKYADLSTQSKSILLVTHIFPTSHVARLRSLAVGSTLHEVNNKEVCTLDDFRKAVRAGSGEKFFTMRVSDNVARVTDNIFISLPYQKIAEQEAELVRDYKCPLTPLSKEISEKCAVKVIPELEVKENELVQSLPVKDEPVKTVPIEAVVKVATAEKKVATKTELAKAVPVNTVPVKALPAVAVKIATTGKVVPTKVAVKKTVLAKVVLADAKHDKSDVKIKRVEA